MKSKLVSLVATQRRSDFGHVERMLWTPAKCLIKIIQLKSLCSMTLVILDDQ